MHDVFICHATEDKESAARPVAKGLSSAGLRVWYDEFSLKLGDSLRRSIDRGLADSRYGVVILSPSFFKKNWPQTELDGLFAKEISETRRSSRYGTNWTVRRYWRNLHYWRIALLPEPLMVSMQ